MKHAAIAMAVAAAFTMEALADLLIPDSGGGDRVMLFDDFDGSLIEVDWLTDSGAVGWFFTTPKEAIVVNDEIWVSDQVADGIHRFDMELNYLGTITAHPAGNGAVLDNLRGMGFDGKYIYLTVYPSSANAALRGIAIYDTAGTPVDFIPINASIFDAEPFDGDLLIANEATDDIERWSISGVLLGTFAADITFPQQVTRLDDGSVLVISSIASAGVEGVYHYNADGSLLRFIDTEIAKVQYGELVPRSAYLLGDGNYLIGASTGVYKYIVASNSFIEVLADVNAQFINPIQFKKPCLADIEPPGGDGNVNVADLLAVINNWGQCPAPPQPCAADIQPPGGNGTVDVGDLLAVINSWGSCQ